MAHWLQTRASASRWLALLGTPVLSLLTFILAYWLDPFRFSRQPLAAIPAFFLSVILLMIGQAITTEQELRRTSVYSDRIYDAIKDYLHVTPIGSPEAAFRYIGSRIPILREVKNTSFNMKLESERADEKLYDTDLYRKVCEYIPYFCSRGLLWKDIGDNLGIGRLRAIRADSDNLSKGRKNGYRLKLINHNEPQINFIILEYEDGITEVLFNWDFRAPGQDPIVLISRDKSIVGMFAIHFEMLWRSASEDHDSHAIRSNSTK